ncbi:MAG: ATP-binding protein [Rhodospirillum sp.]|nr:ATP-binding protein [Rhodospirillum sp.]MCF8490303.1 ATP-binding protein [Rhodospirillum sp.]MCF8500143.1 ATP-binding protein [Rhodospirillum sp.]
MTESPSMADLYAVLERIADALERRSPASPMPTDLAVADAFVWHAVESTAEAIYKVNKVDMALLRGIERQSETLYENTLRFARGFPANNALLWGARGTGKSSLLKAVHAAVNETLDREGKPRVALVEIHREDIPSLPRLLKILAASGRPCLLFCDDLSFDGDDTSYKSLKAVLEGGIEGRPENVIFYATSNRRHLLSREMVENEQSTAIHASEAVEEKVSLSDRFGLWLGFHNLDQATYFDIILGYAKAHGLETNPEQLKRDAKEWCVTRGSRSGRVAWQFIQDVAGREGKRLEG